MFHFRGEWRKWTPYDMEVSDLRDRLTEYPLAFPPTYPFVEDPNAGSSYMRTRCPAWCDRVLMSHQAKTLINDQDDNSAITYDVIGKDVCMGDHKPVFLRCKLKLTSNNLPRVESSSYTNLLHLPMEAVWYLWNSKTQLNYLRKRRSNTYLHTYSIVWTLENKKMNFNQTLSLFRKKRFEINFFVLQNT